MKSNDQKRALFDAVTGLEDDLITEAAAPKIRAFPKRLLCIAACLAVITGTLAFAFGLFSETGSSPPVSPLIISVYALEAGNSSDLRSFILSVDHYGFWAGNISSLSQGLPITLSVDSDKYDSEDITFRVSTDQGGLMIGENGVDQIYQHSYKFFDKDEIILNNTTIYWRTEKQTADEWTRLEGDLAYIDIVIYEKDVIIGHCVCEARRVYMDGVGTSMFQFSVIVNETVSA